MTQNPLLTDFDLPHGVPPFDRIVEDHYLPAIESAIAEAKAHIEALKSNPAPADFSNTIVALETASDRLGMVSGIFYNQLSAASTDGLEALAEKIGPLSAAFSSDVAMDEAIFARVKAVYDQKDSLTLTAEERTLLEDTYKGFVRGGALLPPDQKARLKQINEQLSVIGPAFNNNTKKYADSFLLHVTDEKDLAGLPESARAGARQAAEDKGMDGWLMTLDYPSYLPFITYADHRGLREKIWRAMGMKCYGGEFDNAPHIKNLIALKDERAKILGYRHHADFVLERRMAKSPESVMDFLNKLLGTYKPAALKDLEALKSFARAQGHEEDIKPWDVAYYSEKLKEAEFQFSEEDLRPYFSLEPVLTGVFEHFSRLFGLNFVPTKAYPVWHADVVAYDVFQKDTGRFMGVFYGDFFPRQGKKAGAWKTAYRAQGLFQGQVARPIIAIVCNFTKPTKDTPSLLTHDEVLTLFHEMGHATHALLSDVTYASHAGTSVLWDFVELPSQVQENWAYEKETLDLFARHYKTGDTIPADLIKKVNASKNFMRGWMGLRQVNLGLLDMAWHTANPSEIDDVAAFEDNATRHSTLFPRLAGPTSTSFSHIFGGGYSAGYYSYKWAEVLDADTFEAFSQAGLYNPATAKAYQTEVLSKGGSEDPALLYRRFRGRDADPEALLRREGLAA
ncbi:MAG: M3 family metallopeptidase [Alphaproteobacteria bacterium]|nr:M3 family metallopeptidase [Alphaproteobacteria bacterium]